ncbi:transglutaminase TgpA family protein [Hydrocarboniphaga sp.]|uniref:transglutaminase TgpA family protein n=1 Tax=Hydrocarboniphaga sp. TaxID=2033016 RepID=UPI003D0A0804
MSKSRRSARTVEHLPQRSLLRLLAVMLLVIAPHLFRLPLWEATLVLAIALWRGTAALRHWRMPHPLIKVALTLGVFAAVFATYGRVWGQNAGVALLVVMLSLKLTELRERRDVMVTVFLLYFLLVTHFLYSQELWTVAYLLISTISITALLIDVHHEGESRPLKMALRLASTLVLQSLPLMLLMFVLFPRLPGPLWTLPDDAGSSRSGLSDTMSPGDISQLALSEDIAFRVRFVDAAPPESQRYWRGPLLTDFDGITWRASQRLARAPLPDAQLDGTPLRYEITLEPTRQNWLFALDLPAATQLPERTRLTAEYQLVSNEPVRELRRYALVSQPRYRLQTRLPDSLRDATLALPPRGNPRASALARQWRGNAHSDMDVVRAALALFHQAPFAYTLSPPSLGNQNGDRIDAFLFGTRAGYCEHYAGAFTYLMRAAGIPARVVTGYAGGDRNPFGDWYVIRQANAHAWSEVWIADQGWVRVDPTSAVSPERVDRSVSESRNFRAGSSAALGELDWSALRYRLESSWDWIDARWNGLVLGYGTDQQRDFLSRIGLGDWQSMLLALTGTVTTLLAVLGIALMRRNAPAPLDPALQLWQRGLRPLQKLGFQQRPDEGARDFVQRVLITRPDLREPLQRLLAAYLRVRYEGDAASMKALEHAARSPLS